MTQSPTTAPRPPALGQDPGPQETTASCNTDHLVHQVHGHGALDDHYYLIIVILDDE